LLLGVTEHDVFDLAGGDARSLNEGLDYRHSEVVRADVAEVAFFFVCPTDWSADTVDNNGVFHSKSFSMTRLGGSLALPV
jgi:hypothetical protein